MRGAARWRRPAQIRRSPIDTTICLVRHGETIANHEGRLQGRETRPLTELGRRQSQWCANFLARFEWDFIAASPTRRAHDSALIVAHRVGLADVEVMAEFEAREPGAAYQMTVEERARSFPDGNIPGAEPRPAVQERAMRGMHHLITCHPGQRLILVSHREVLHLIFAAITDGTLGTGKSKLASGSASLVHFRDGEWEVEWYNGIGHLEVLT